MMTLFLFVNYFNDWESHFAVEGDHPAHEAEQASIEWAAETHPTAGVQPLSDRPGEAEQL